MDLGVIACDDHHDGHLVARGNFAGHYVDVDEATLTSEEGAAKGWAKGALAGLLLTPAGFAVGSAFDVDDSQVTSRTLTDDELAVIEVALSDEPAAATSSGLAADASRGAL